jgi:hypothetical protein
MLKIIFLIAFPILTLANDNCAELFRAREEGLAAAKNAYLCYKENLPNETAKENIAHHLNQMSYLKFFMAEYFMEEKTDFLLDAIDLSEKALLLFGQKYSIPAYEKLMASEKKVLAVSLYNYGLTTSRYVDIKGQWEAIKRMGDIKRSMDSILRIKEDSTAVYGAHRTLGIFHMKVPAIAGGKIELSKQYLTLAIENSRDNGDISLYPANNIAYSDLMLKLGNNEESCRQLQMVAVLTESDIRSMKNDLFYESMEKVKEAKSLLNSRKCAK